MDTYETAEIAGMERPYRTDRPWPVPPHPQKKKGFQKEAFPKNYDTNRMLATRRY